MDHVKREFKKNNLGLNHESPQTIAEPQCGGVSILYLVYRWVVALYLLITLIYSGVVYQFGFKYLIYLTYWSFIILNVSTLLLAVTATYHFIKAKSSDTNEGLYMETPVLFKVTWHFYNIAKDAAIVISVMYWGLVYQPSWELNVINISTHAVNSIFIIIDIFITGVPIRLLHIYQGMVYAFCYGVFNVIYWAAGGLDENGRSYIYSPLNWGKSPGFAVGVLVIVVFVATPLVHIVLFFIYKLRVFLYSKCCGVTKDTYQSGATDDNNVQTEETAMSV